MQMNRLASFVLIFCGCAGMSIPEKGLKTDTQADDRLSVGTLRYELCGMLSISSHDPAYGDAIWHFHEATDHHSAARKSADVVSARLQREAGSDFLAGAVALGKIASRTDPCVVYNRRVAYANGINTWLNLGLVQEARRALLLAAEDDPQLADELNQTANRLPFPMRCTPQK